MPLSRSNRNYVERKLFRGGTEALGQGRAGLAQAPGMEQIMALLQQMQGQLGGLGQERQNLMSNLGQVSPQMQELARSAAFSPIEGMQPYMDQALSQTANAAASRGLSRGSISAAMQAQAIPQIMGPALAQARGQYSQSLLDLPFRQFGAGMEGLQAGMGLAGMTGQLAGQQAGLRSQAFADLESATIMAQYAQQLAQQRSRSPWGGVLGALGGMAGAALSGGLSMIPGIGGMFGGGGGGGGGGPSPNAQAGAARAMGGAPASTWGGIQNVFQSGQRTLNPQMGGNSMIGFFGQPGSVQTP